MNGDARKVDEATYLSKISPIELVAHVENGPAFLIVNGRHDSRVNPAHSIKFAKAAEDLRVAGKNTHVELMSLNNSGHPVSAPENDYIAIRSLLVIWSRIYDDFGMSF